MKHKYGIAGFIIALSTFIPTPSIASNYEDFPLTSGQIKFIKLIDTKSGTNFSKLIDTPNANRIISAATFACTHTSFQKNSSVLLEGTLKHKKIFQNYLKHYFVIT